MAAASCSSCPPGPGGLLLLLLGAPFLLASPAPAAPWPEGAPPRCHTDFASALACSFGAPPPARCARDFRLRLLRPGAPREPEPEQPPEEEEEEEEEAAASCVPEAEGPRGPAARRCSCTLRRGDFRHVRLRLALERRAGGRWRQLWGDTLTPEDVVKPRPLVNLTIEKTNCSFILSWSWDYEPRSALAGAKADYQVTYWPKGQKEKGTTSTTSKPKYEVFADRLIPASDYVASVRFKLEDWGNLWSEWSAPFEWHNDFKPGEEPWRMTLWLCIPLVAMILAGYLSFTRVKRDCWDHIPSPAKSKMAQSMTMFPLPRRIPCEGKTLPLGPSKGSDEDSGSKATATATLFTPSLLHEAVPGGRDGGNNPRAKAEVFLTPEVAVVECPLVICSRATEAKSQKEEGEEEPIPCQDMVAGLFRDLLNGDFSSGEAQLLEAPAAANVWGTPGGSVGLALEGIPSAPNLPLEALSKSGYQGSGTESCPAEPGHHPGHGCASAGRQPGSAVLPQRSARSVGADGFCPWLDSPAAGSITMTGYRSISSLVPQPSATPSCMGEGEVTSQGLPHSGQIQPQGGHTRPCSPPPELQSTLPAGLDALWLSAAALGLTPWQEGSPEHPTQVALGKPEESSCTATASVFSGYRSFASALQDTSAARDGNGSSDALALLSPYKPLLTLLWSSGGGPIPLEGRLGAGSPAWPEGP